MIKFVLSIKYWIIAAVCIAAVGIWFFMNTSSAIPDGVEVEPVAKEDVVETISETGFVLPSLEVTLAFERGGRVSEIGVATGDTVQEGDVLVRLDSSQQEADLNAAFARLDAEKIRLSELISGADDTSLAVTQSSVAAAQTTLQNAERNLQEVIAQQDQLVANAEKTLRSSGLEAYLISEEQGGSDDVYDAPVITGTYNSDEEGVYTIELYSSSAPSGASFRISGLENGTQSVSTVNPVALGSRGLYIQFPEDFANRTRWEIPIPNTRGASHLTHQNAYKAVQDARSVAIASAENAVETAKAALEQSQSQYVQVSGSAREERVAAQRALVRQMEASVDLARVSRDNTVITAPFSGVVTAVNTEVGEIIAATAPVISLISQHDFDIVVNISESDIEHVNIGDTATVVLDAYADQTFTAQVTYIAPNALIQDGVRVFEVKLQFSEQSDRIRSGLSADIDLVTEIRSDVIAVPTRAIVENEDGKFVRAFVNEKLTYIPVTTGLRGSNGMTEIQSGLTEGQPIIGFVDSDTLKLLETN